MRMGWKHTWDNGDASCKMQQVPWGEAQHVCKPSEAAQKPGEENDVTRLSSCPKVNHSLHDSPPPPLLLLTNT